MSLALIVLAATALATKQPADNHAVTVNCSISGGTNNGLLIQNCMPGMSLLRPAPGDPDHPIHLSDGSFLHEFVFETPRPTAFETTICSPDLIDFTISGISGISVISRKLIDVQVGCITKDLTQVSGTFSLVVHTKGSSSAIHIKSTFFIPLPVVTGIDLTPQVDTAAIVAADMFIPPPDIISLPGVISDIAGIPGIHGEMVPGIGMPDIASIPGH